MFLVRFKGVEERGFGAEGSTRQRLRVSELGELLLSFRHIP